MPTACDCHSRELSQFVVDRALADWCYFVSELRRLDLSINLPISFLEDPASIDYLRRQLPDHPAFDGLIVEVDGGDITRDLSVARKFANDARLQKIAISVDRLGDDWATLTQLRDFPFVKIKVDRELVPAARMIAPNGACASTSSKSPIDSALARLRSGLRLRLIF